MGLETTTYRLLKELDTEGKTCLCLGYPDLLVLPEEISGTYDELADAKKKARKLGFTIAGRTRSTILARCLPRN